MCKLSVVSAYLVSVGSGEVGSGNGDAEAANGDSECKQCNPSDEHTLRWRGRVYPTHYIGGYTRI